MLDKDTSLAEKIQALFREQRITIASILTDIGVLVEALLPGGGGGTAGTTGKPSFKDEKGAKEWIRNKLVLPGIIGMFISHIPNRAADVVDWVSQNLWTLVVGIGGLLYTYMSTK